ncbi:MAG: DEAD/DEAH box helicase [Candidatus Dormibacteria bacterium]
MIASPLPSPTAVAVGPSIHLRPYQQEAVASIEKAFADGVRRQLVSLPTGTGKTVVFAEVIRRRQGRALVIAHRDELIRQAVDKLHAVAPGLAVGVVKAGEDETDAQVVVASIQTLQREARRTRLGGGFTTIVVDEAHHSAAPSYRGVLARFGSFDRDDLLTLGVTATPERGDRQRLECFPTLVYERDLVEMMREGYLADLRAVQVSITADLDKVTLTHGDFAAEALGKAMREAAAPELVARAYKDFAPNRRALIFTPTVALAHETAAAMTASGVTASALDGTTPIDERRGVLAQLRQGGLQALANCAVLTEGFDEPSIDCIVMARPTKSRQLYLQMVGRGTRPYPGKPDCLILDLVGVSHRHKLLTAATLFDLPKGAFGQGAHSLTGILDAQEAEAQPEGELVAFRVDLFQRSDLRWRVLPDGAASLSVEGGVILVRQADGRWTTTLVPYRQGVSPTPLAESPDEGYAYGAAEDYVRDHKMERLTAKNASWRESAATEGQLAQLDRIGAQAPANITRGQASELIEAAQAERWLVPATEAQLWRLRKEGVEIRPGLTKREASSMIDELAKNAEPPR